MFAACNTPKPPAPPPPEPEIVSVRPVWLDMPLSWEKLVAIEDWLATDGLKSHQSLRIEALLQLNEGRVTYSRKDLERSSAPAQTVRVRIAAARDGFKIVLDDPNAGNASKARAKIGVQSTLALLDSPITSRSDVSIVERSEWRAKAGRAERLTPMRGAWSRITVHHSDESRSPLAGGTLEESEEVVRLIQKFHMEDPDHKWGDIGYHFMIDSAGRIFRGRELKWQGAHAGGAGGVNNLQNLGVCLLGDFSKRSPTEAAFKSLELLLSSLREEHKIPAARVFPHKEFTTTQCPGPALTNWLKDNVR